MKELRTSYAVVLPLCFICKSEGKFPICKRPSDVAKWAKNRDFFMSVAREQNASRTRNASFLENAMFLCCYSKL